MPFHLELGSDGHSFGGRAIVVNSQTGKHYSKDPLSLKSAKAQLRVLEQASKKEGDPCWKGYRQVGMKMKGGREVPNCVKE